MIGSVLPLAGKSFLLACTFATIASAEDNQARPALSAPTSLSLSDPRPNQLLAGGNSLRLSWVDTNNAESGYEAQISIDGGATWLVKGATAANATSLVLEQLTLPAAPSQSLRVRVRATSAQYPAGAVGSQGAGSPAVSSALVYSFGTLYAPTGLAVAGFSATNLTVRWRDTNIYESRYEAHVSYDAGQSWRVAATSDYSGLLLQTVAVQGIDAAAAQQGGLRVRMRTKGPGEAVYANGSPAGNDQVSQPLQVGVEALLQPASSLSITEVGADFVRLQWLDTNLFEAGYQVQTSTDAQSWQGNASVGANATGAVATGIVFPVAGSGQVLYLRVRTMAAGEGPAPAAPAVATVPLSFDGNALRPVAGLSLVSLSGTPGQPGGQVRFAWQDTNTAEGGYEVQVSYDAPTASATWTPVASLQPDSTTAEIGGLQLPSGANQHLRLRVRTRAVWEPGAPAANIFSAPLSVVDGAIVPANELELYGVNPLAALVRFREANLPAYCAGYEPQTSDDDGATWTVREWGGDGLMPTIDPVGRVRGAVAGCVVPSFSAPGRLKVRLRTLRATESARAAGTLITAPESGAVLSGDVVFTVLQGQLPQLFPAADLYFESKSADGCKLVFTDTNIDENGYAAWISFGQTFPQGHPNAGELMYYRNKVTGDGSGSLPAPADDGAVQRSLQLSVPYEALAEAELAISRGVRVESLSRQSNGEPAQLPVADSVNPSSIQGDPHFSPAAAMDWGGELLQLNVPGQPTTLRAALESVNLTTIRLQWSDQSTSVNRPQRFELHGLTEGEDPNADDSWELVGTVGTLGFVYTGNALFDVPDLLPSRTYTFRVRSVRQGPWIATSAAVNAGGSGYAVGNELVTTGHAGTPARLRVSAVAAGGSVAAFQVLAGGAFGDKQTLAYVLSGGQGSGARATLGFGSGSGNAIYTSGWSNSFKVQMSTPVATPLNLRKVSGGVTSRTMRWDASPYATGYQLRWRQLGTGAWTTLPATGQYFPQSTLQTTVAGLLEGTQHEFQVRAVNTLASTDILSAWSASFEDGYTSLYAPTNVVSTSVSTSGVRISWTDESLAESRYEVRRWQEPSGPWTPWYQAAAQTGSQGTGSYTFPSDDNLFPGTNFDFELRAVRVDAAGAIYADSAVVAFTGSTAPLPAPTNLRVLWRETGRFEVAWDGIGAYAGRYCRYQAWIRDEGSATWYPGWVAPLGWILDAAGNPVEPDRDQIFTRDAIIQGSSNPHLAAMQPNGRKFVKIQTCWDRDATDGLPIDVMGGPDSYTPEIAVDLCNCNGSPTSTPTIAGIGVERLTVTWPATSGATHYQLFISSTSATAGFTNAAGSGVDLPATTNVYYVTGLSEGTQYWVKLRAFNRSVEPQYQYPDSPTDSATTDLGAPTGVVAEAVPGSETELRVRWTDNASGETRYKVERTEANDPSTWTGLVYDAAGAGTGGSLTYTYASGIWPSTQFSVRVTAEKVVGSTVVARSSTVVGAGSSIELPAATGISLLSRTATSASIDWNGQIPFANGYLRYNAQISTTGTGGWVDGYTSPLPEGDYNQDFTGLASGGTYYFRVQTYWHNLPYASGQSIAVQGPDSTVFGPVTLCNCNGATAGPPTITGTGTGSMSVTWPATSGATHYQLFYSSTSATSGYVNAAGTGVYLPSTTTSYSIGSLNEGTEHWVKVRAFNLAATPTFQYADSGTDSAYTDLLPPSLVSAGAVPGSQTGLRVTWTDNSNGETRYMVERTEANSSSTWTGLVYDASGAGSGAVQTYDYATGIWPSTQFSVRVTAQKVVGSTIVASSSTVVGSGLSIELPVATNLHLILRNSSQAELAWSGATTFAGGYMRWQAQISPTGTGSWVSGNDVPLPETDHDQLFSGISSTTNYYFRVRSWWHNVPYAAGQVITVSGGYSDVWREP